jgi:hypothetical protein
MTMPHKLTVADLNAVPATCIFGSETVQCYKLCLCALVIELRNQSFTFRLRSRQLASAIDSPKLRLPILSCSVKN